MNRAIALSQGFWSVLVFGLAAYGAAVCGISQQEENQ
ncbi:hypothetical protein SAMN05216264_105281 [Pseudomonas marincola]|jgi:hypothetical protein|nr:hypothetical protein SAMN05216264_105281 [Pseudomonas marincola]|tara:strand:+ start:544 stop:654 length:111 start_codon:yes stop_codon:yes gene_type:complete